MNFEKHATKGNEFLNSVAWRLNDPANKDRAGRVVRCVFRAMRNRLTIEESAQLMAQLPLVIKGLYVDGWIPQKRYPKVKTMDEFVQVVIAEDGTSALRDFSGIEDAMDATEAVIKTLAEYVSQGELRHMVAILPKDMKSYFLTWVDNQI